MRRFRTAIFWVHLTAGVTAGVVILVMCATGAALALKPQILSVVESRARTVQRPAGEAARASVASILANVAVASPHAQPTAVTLQRDPSVAAVVALGRDGNVYVEPYTGRVLGTGSQRAQTFFRFVEDWHRWLGVPGDGRATARAVTGACNLAFFVLAVTGPYLWWPRSWTWANVRTIVCFRRAGTGRARDFNWHNTIGFWCAPVLAILTLTGVVMSYPWANRLLYQAAGSVPPVANGGPAAAGPVRARDGQAPAIPTNIDRALAHAEAQVPTWRSINLRLPNRPRAPFAFTVVDGQSWNQFARSQLTIDAAGETIVAWEPYEATSPGQKLRGWVRFAHTGELGGPVAQTIAGLACVGGAVLVWTGLALAIRRLIGWRLWRFTRATRSRADAA